MRLFDRNWLKIYLVLESSLLKLPLPDFIRQVTQAGVTAIQLRDKSATDRQRYETGLLIQQSFPTHKPLFIVNDNIDIALAVKADGVHLGVKDIPIEAAKRVASGLFFGYSCNSVDDCRMASGYADYAGVGPVFATDTKKDLRKILGLQGLAENINSISCPCVAIGGLDDKNCREVLASGADGVAISSYICSSANPYERVSSLLKIIDGYERV